MTRKELLDKKPELNQATAGHLAPGGGVIDIDTALESIGGYALFTSTHSLQQPISVGFKSDEFIAWLRTNETKMDEVNVFFGLDGDGKFTVIFWPYKNGVPTVADENNQNSVVTEVYNIGSRHPII